MSGQEFTRWLVFLAEEQRSSAFERLRHAQLLAGLHNSGRVGKQDKSLFTAGDFMPAEPWAEAEESRDPTFEEIAAAAAAMFHGGA